MTADWWRERAMSMTILAVSVLALAFAITVRPSPQLTALDVRSGAVTIIAGREVVIEQSMRLRAPGLVAGTIASASVDDRQVTAELARELLARLAGARLTLDRLALHAGTRIGISSTDAGCRALATSSGRLDLTLSATDSGTKQDVSIDLRIAGDPRGSSEVILCPERALDVTMTGVSSVEFDRRIQPDSLHSYAISAIAAATVSFPTLDLERKIVPLHGLLVSGIEPGRPLLLAAPPSGEEMAVRYLGKAKLIETGDPTDRRSLMPTLLEHLLGQSPVATLLAGFSFIWGMIWGLVRFWSSSSKE